MYFTSYLNEITPNKQQTPNMQRDLDGLVADACEEEIISPPKVRRSLRRSHVHHILYNKSKSVQIRNHVSDSHFPTTKKSHFHHNNFLCLFNVTANKKCYWVAIRLLMFISSLVFTADTIHQMQ